MKRYTQDEVRDRLHKAAGWKGAYKLAERIGAQAEAGDAGGSGSEAGRSGYV